MAVARSLARAHASRSEEYDAGIAEARGKAKEASAWLELADGMRPIVAVLLLRALHGVGVEGRLRRRRQGGAGVLAFFLLIRGWTGVLRLRGAQRRAPLGETMRFDGAGDVRDGRLRGRARRRSRASSRHFVGLEAAGRYDLAYRIALLTQAVNVVFRRSSRALFYSRPATAREALHVRLRGGREGGGSFTRAHRRVSRARGEGAADLRRAPSRARSRSSPSWRSARPSGASRCSGSRC